MATSIGGWFDKVFFDAHGKPCASGELRFYQTGTDIPQGVATFDGTPLGAVIRLDDDGRPESDFRFYTDKIYRVVVVDADGVVVKTIDGVAIPEGEGGGMYNPMTDEGDMIFGGPAGAGRRLGIGVDGDILAVAPQGGGLSPKWEAGPKKYRKVLSYVPTPSIDDGFLGCLYYLSGTAQTIELPPATNIPSKSFIDFVFLDNVATLTITPQGGSVLNAQSSAITIGGQAASMYRLTFLGRGDIGGVPTDQWALGGSGNGDHKVMVDGADGSPGYLLDKLTDGDNAHFSKSGNAVKLDADNDKVAADNTDTAPGYLFDKLYPGDGVSIEAVTDGAVRKVKVSATGGGGGGGGFWQFAPVTNKHFYFKPVNGTPSDTSTMFFVRYIPFRNISFNTLYLRLYGFQKNPSIFEVGLYYNDNGLHLIDSSKNLSVVTPAKTPYRVPLGKTYTLNDNSKEYMVAILMSRTRTNDDYIDFGADISVYSMSSYSDPTIGSAKIQFMDTNRQTGFYLNGTLGSSNTELPATVAASNIPSAAGAQAVSPWLALAME